MKAHLRLLLTLLLVPLFFPSAHAQPYPSFYYVLPPKGAVTINDTAISNPLEYQGKMFFQRSSPETLLVSPKQSGVQIVHPSYGAHVKADASVVLTDSLELKFGSVHMRSEKKPSQVFFSSGYSISFTDAEFLLFVSANQENPERIIKVLEGEVQVEYPAFKQKAILKKGESSTTDNLGRLLIPFSFDLNAVIRWWEKGYGYQYLQLPKADAGEDQRVLPNIPVILDGSRSSFKTGDIFEWILQEGPKDESGKEVTEVSFESTNIVRPKFTPVLEGEYRFTLQVINDDDAMSNLDEVVIFVGKKYLVPTLIYADVPQDHPSNLAITYLSKKQVLKDMELFRPDDTVNRVEILKILFENKKSKIPSPEEMKTFKEKIFLDVKPEHWFAPYVLLAKKEKLIQGSDGVYRPADAVLLSEAVKILLELHRIDISKFQKPGPWYTPYIEFLKKNKLLDPDVLGKIDPLKPLSRAELAEMIFRLEGIENLEKKGTIQGKLKVLKTGKGVANAEVYFYRAKESSKNEGFAEKGDLYFKTFTKPDGTFSVSLPIGQKFYIEGISGNNVSVNRIITEVDEEKPTKIELEMYAPANP